MSSDKQQTPPVVTAPMAQDRAGQRVIWRSLEDKANPAGLAEAACGSDVVKRNVSGEELFSLNRRKFLTLSGAIGTLASIEGCIRRPVEKILPYSDMPEHTNPGVAMHYATVMSGGGQPLGLVVTTHEGRPTKVEGNPDHPASLGATDIWAQSSILDLYDPERSHQPHDKGAPSTFAAFDAFFAAKLQQLKPRGGAGVFILAQPTHSPSFVRLRELVVRALPRASFVTYSPVTQGNARLGAVIAFGQPVVPLHDFSRAKVVLSLDSDFMGTDPGSTLATRGFGQARGVSGTGEMNRLYAVEPMMSITGSNADHRLRVAGQDIGRYTRALAAELSANHGVALGPLSAAVTGTATDGVPEAWLKAVAKDLVSNRGRSLIVVGYRQPPAVHALVAAINRGLGNLGSTISYVTPVDQTEVDPFVALTYLQREIEQGRVETLITLGGNPVYDAPGDLRFAEAYKKVPTTIHFSSHFDETAALATWQVPRAHELESWGDAQSLTGHYSVQQPLLAPLWGGRSDIEVLAQLAGIPAWRGHELVQATVQERGIRGELAWRQLLHKGVSDQSFSEAIPNLGVRDAEVAGALKQLGEAAPLAEGTFEAVFVPDSKLYDGRYANNGWLLELPDPLTRITWDNAVLIAPSTAKQLGIKNGDMVRVKKGDVAIDIVAWSQPGVAARSLILPLGWGRTKAGSTGNKRGFDVNPLRASTSPHFLAGATIEKLDRAYPISTTQEHDVMEGRPIVLETTLAEYKQKPNFVAFESPDPHYGPLWAGQDYSQGNQWGMVVDLNTCSGCSACVIACQAENNIPIVGKQEVARGREMHWLRIDRYYVGEDADEPEVAFQAIACQHCETAPCENVCPVAATAHSPEGLNDIAYNRCIGTRYCMNNCPYKVRRFNFLNYNEDIPETRQMQMNPNVTVRFRGVVEKCTYCVQRIQVARSKAKQQGRGQLRDGEVVVACQQACASGSISFGDINDKQSEFSKKHREERSYGLLAEIGTRPRTRFLGKIRNPNPEMKA
jgi:Fe-S-cluster-containing dehydrogenase component/anaerobic selenocysteine-containing dehydrogenase